MKIPRIVLAGATSGVGKTSISCGLIYALKNSGYSVQPFKVGPDYIDPSYLSNISGYDTCNLDAWLMGSNHVLKSFITNSKCDISVIEGVMGFYDGFGGDSNFASTFHIANIIKAPVILILDASKTSRSIAATALGFKKFHRNSRICGIILNKLGSSKHESLCRQALECTGIPVLGAIYRHSDMTLESRHLGLIPALTKNIQKKLLLTSKMISDSLDVSKILDIINVSSPLPTITKPKIKKPKVTISVALDNSFNFYYRDNLNALKREGAHLEFFSPINGKLADSDGIYIGGGFPEVLGSQLEKNQTMKTKIKKLSDADMPIYAECGGLMYLTKFIHFGKKRYKMTGIFNAETQMTKKMTLNYTKGKVVSKSIISNKPHTFHGHEFHYSELYSVPSDSKFLYNLQLGTGIKDNNDGLIINNTLASYGHVYFDHSDYASVFVKNCRSSSRR